MRKVCIFHAGCPDGFGAAWAARHAWGDDALFVARGHNDPLQPERYRGDQVVFADIAPPLASYRPLAASAAQLVVLDHHYSAREHFVREPGLLRELESGGHTVRFDLEHSGAVLAWNWFHPSPDRPAPPLFAYIEDQDLWHWKLPGSREVNAAIAATPRRFEAWDALLARSIAELIHEGAPLLRAKNDAVEQRLESAHPVQIGEHRLEAVQAQHFRADIGHRLSERARFGKPCGVVYRTQGKRVDITLYSIGDFDVAAIAGHFGGGGHRNAAGFSLTKAAWRECQPASEKTKQR